MSKQIFRGTISAIFAGVFAATVACGAANASPTMAKASAATQDHVRTVQDILSNRASATVVAPKVDAKKVEVKKVAAKKALKHKATVKKVAVRKTAVRPNVVIQIDKARVQHVTVRKGQKLWLAVNKSSLNGVDVRVKSHGVLRPVKTKVFGLTDKQTAALGFKKSVQPEGDVFKAAKIGRAKIVATESRPTLGGIPTSWNEVVYVHVKK